MGWKKYRVWDGDGLAMVGDCVHFGIVVECSQRSPFHHRKIRQRRSRVGWNQIDSHSAPVLRFSDVPPQAMADSFRFLFMFVTCVPVRSPHGSRVVIAAAAVVVVVVVRRFPSFFIVCCRGERFHVVPLSVASQYLKIGRIRNLIVSQDFRFTNCNSSDGPSTKGKRQHVSLPHRARRHRVMMVCLFGGR